MSKQRKSKLATATQFCYIAPVSKEISQFDGETQLNGSLSMPGVRVGGQLAYLGRVSRKGGRALAADGAQIAGLMILGDGCVVEGEVSLVAADIGHLVLRGGSFLNASGNAISARSAIVRGAVDVLASRGGATNIVGLVDFDFAHIHGPFLLNRIAFASGTNGGMSLGYATIGGLLSWRNLNFDDHAIARLRHTSTTVFECNPLSWPKAGHYSLDYCLYSSLNEVPRHVDDRRGWVQTFIHLLNRQESFSPQSYDQLEAALRAAGYENEATSVAIERRRLSRSVAGTSRRARFANWFLDWTIRYGYALFRPLKAAAVIWVVGAVIFAWGMRHGIVSPASTPARPHGGLAVEFLAPVLSLDVLLPIVDLGEEKLWQVSGNGVSAYAILASFWVETILGWVISTVLIAGLSGITSRR